jgi:hypothetical protein
MMLWLLSYVLNGSAFRLFHHTTKRAWFYWSGI